MKKLLLLLLLLPATFICPMATLDKEPIHPIIPLLGALQGLGLAGLGVYHGYQVYWSNQEIARMTKLKDTQTSLEMKEHLEDEIYGEERCIPYHTSTALKYLGLAAVFGGAAYWLYSLGNT